MVAFDNWLGAHYSTLATSDQDADSPTSASQSTKSAMETSISIFMCSSMITVYDYTFLLGGLEKQCQSHLLR